MESKSLIYGQRVKVGAKEGIIIDAADKYKVKFDDGTVGFFEYSQVIAIVEDTRLKAQNLKQGQTFMEPTATGEDPLSQPRRKTDRGVGEPQNVMGKTATIDRLA